MGCCIAENQQSFNICFVACVFQKRDPAVDTIVSTAGSVVVGKKGFDFAVPEKITGLTLFLDFFDRGSALCLASSAAGSARQRPHRGARVQIHSEITENSQNTSYLLYMRF